MRTSEARDRFFGKVRNEVQRVREDPNFKRAQNDARARYDAAKTPEERERANAVTIVEFTGVLAFHYGQRGVRRAHTAVRQRLAARSARRAAAAA